MQNRETKKRFFYFWGFYRSTTNYMGERSLVWNAGASVVKLLSNANNPPGTDYTMPQNGF